MRILEQTLERIRSQDTAARQTAKDRLDQLTMPHWAMGRILDLSLDLAGITGSQRPPYRRRTIIAMAADHGVVAEGVSRYPQEVTAQMVHNFVAGGASINAMARQARTDVLVVDMGVAGDLSALYANEKLVSKRIGAGTGNIAKEPAMSRQEAVRAIEAGIEIVNSIADEVDVFGTGDMGIGNTTPSTAILAAVTGMVPADVTGVGTGIDDTQLLHKIRVIEAALQANRPDASDGIDLLAKVGGFEIGGIAGVILGAAAQRKPVVIDGFISTAGALIAQLLAPAVTDNLIAAHRSAERGHRTALAHLKKEPLLDLDMRLGEGTGAALAMNLVEAAARLLTEVATFEEATVSEAKM